jgi:hypothetical protein
MSDLTALELTRLATEEAVIERGLSTFVHVGTALAAIRNERLYRATHATFADYAADRWGFGRSYAYRMINAAGVAEAVSPIGDIRNEGQARELSGLDPGVARETYERARQESGTEQPTAQDLRDAREQLGPRPAPEPDPEPDADVTKWLDSDQTLQDARYVGAFIRTVANSDNYLEFDPERIGRLADDDTWHVLEDLPGRAERFLKKAKAARSRFTLLDGGVAR